MGTKVADASRPVAVVTGGTGGLGQWICRALADSGFDLVVGYSRSRQAAEDLATSLPAGRHLALELPVTEADRFAVGAEVVANRFGRLDALVNCAGLTRFVPHHDLDALEDELIQAIFETNVRGVIVAVRAFRRLLEKSVLKSGGVVVNISSIAGTTAIGSNIAYCASKAAVDNLTMSLARALAPAIRVVSVAPGLVDTEFVRSLDRGWRDEQAESTPLGRLAEPSEVASAVVAAICCLTATTGSIVHIDGGRPLT